VPDGTVNADRFIKNMELYSEIIRDADSETAESLKAVLAARLKAVKTGLGADVYASIKSALSKRLKVMEPGFKKATADFFRKRIFEETLKKAEE